MASPKVYLSPPSLAGNERAYLEQALASNWIAPVGPALDAFEARLAERIGVKAALAVCSGTAAIHLALRDLKLGPGDEVVCPTLTFCASVNPVCYEQASPVFLDVDPHTWCLDPNLLEEELQSAAATGKPVKAVITVDILGQSCDYDAILDIAGRYGAVVIDDAAEALGAMYRGQPVGRQAAAAAFSFNGNKIITTSGGGMLVSDDEDFIARARHLSTQARDPAPHYQHSKIGFNYRLSNLLAAVGLAQLETLDARIATRRGHFEFYRKELTPLPGVTMFPVAEYGSPNYWLSTALIDAAAFGATNDDVRRSLAAAGFESRPVWKPLHLQPVFAHCRYRGAVVAERIFERGLCLPSGDSLTPQQRKEIVDVIRECCRAAV